MTDAPPPRGADEAPADAAYRFRVGGFEGPLDLLLHLVRVNEVEITDIPIVEITRQYLGYLDLMRELNLEIAGEYLVMAATLMHIKSQTLLPSEPEAEEEGEDPRAELTRQLLDYQRYKQAAENLQAIDSVRSLVWTREGVVPAEFRGEELLTVDLFEMLQAFRKLLGRLGEESRLRLRRDSVSVVDKIRWLGDVLERRGTVSLAECLESFAEQLDRIALFLAVLEMVRLQQLVIYQRRLFGEIRMARRRDVAEIPAPAGESGTHTFAGGPHGSGSGEASS
jgi:segregation and condensation protein A